MPFLGLIAQNGTIFNTWLLVTLIELAKLVVNPSFHHIKMDILQKPQGKNIMSVNVSQDLTALRQVNISLAFFLVFSF